MHCTSSTLKPTSSASCATVAELLVSPGINLVTEVGESAGCRILYGIYDNSATPNSDLTTLNHLCHTMQMILDLPVFVTNKICILQLYIRTTCICHNL